MLGHKDQALAFLATLASAASLQKGQDRVTDSV